MTDSPLSGEVVPKPQDNLPANEVHGPKGLAERYGDAAFLFESGEKAEDEMSDAYTSLIEQILNAETPDQILTPVEVSQPRDVVGMPLEIFEVRWQRSEYEVGSPMYASIEAKRIETGDPVVVNCGQKPVMAQLVRLKQLGALPFRAYFRETGRNAHGTAMYRLTTLPNERQQPASSGLSEPPF
jgi:hypothetical protein